MVNFGLISRFLTQRHFGYCTGPSMFVLDQFLFYLYIQSAEAYMGTARMLRKNCIQRQDENEKGTKTMGKSELSQTVLARTRRRLGRRSSLWMNSGIPVIMDWQRRARPLLLLRSSSSVLMYLRYPRRGLNCTSQHSGYHNHEAQAFLAQIYYQTDRQIGIVTILSRPRQARASPCNPRLGLRK